MGISFKALPSVDVRWEPNNQVELIGLYGEVWEEMVKNLGLNFTVAMSHQYGGKNEDGSWSGMVGMLHRNEADIAVADFTPTNERYEVVDFFDTSNVLQ